MRYGPVPSTRLLLGMLALMASLFLAGCKQELYSDMPEVDANEMVAILMSHGIDAAKTVKGKDAFTVSVDERDMLRAISLLKDRGLPRTTKDSISKEFQKSGIISSPFEERVRYIYALGEEVAQTLSQIDGVVTARVHLVIPDAPQLGQAVKPSSASVFIKHQPGTDLDYLVPQIRRLVSSAIEGLDYQSVTVVLVEAKPNKQDIGPAMVSTESVLPGLSVRYTDVTWFWQLATIVAALIGLLVAGIAALSILLWRAKGGGKRSRGGANLPAEIAVEPS